MTEGIINAVKYAINTSRNRNFLEAEDVARAARADVPCLKCIHDLSTLDLKRVLYHLGYRIRSTRSYFNRKIVSHLPPSFWKKRVAGPFRVGGRRKLFTNNELKDYGKEMDRVIQDLGGGEITKDEICNRVYAYPDLYPELKWLTRTGMRSLIIRLGYETKIVFGGMVVMTRKGCRSMASSKYIPMTEPQKALRRIIVSTRSPYYVDTDMLLAKVSEKAKEIPCLAEITKYKRVFTSALIQIGYKYIQRDAYFSGHMQHLPKNIFKLRSKNTQTVKGKCDYCVGELEDMKNELMRAIDDIDSVDGDIRRRNICRTVWENRERYPVLWWTSERNMSRLIFTAGYSHRIVRVREGKKRVTDIKILPPYIKDCEDSSRADVNICLTMNRLRADKLKQFLSRNHRVKSGRGIYRSPSF